MPFHKFPLLILALLTAVSLSAQSTIPQKAEDISPLLIGESLPNLPVYSLDNVATNLSDILSKPTVLIFYRGSWCPYCNVHLSELAKIEADIIQLGYQIVAISPDDFQNLSGTLEKDSLGYQLYSDKKAQLIQAMGIGFAANEKTKGYITKKTLGEATDILPVPSVFIVHEKNEILMEYINPNYRQRLSGDLLLAILKNLGSEQK